MKDSLRQRWHSSINCLVNELYSQCCCSSSSAEAALSTQDTPTTITYSSSSISLLSNNWLAKVEALYNEPHRAYHNMMHVEDVLSSLDFLMAADTQPKEESNISFSDKDDTITTLAAFFHDVIYNPKSSTNEKDSAELFLEFASELYIAIVNDISTSSTRTNDEEKTNAKHNMHETLQSNKMISQVEQCIIATATHIASANEARESNNTLIAIFLDGDMSILGKDTERYNTYASQIRNEYEFVERTVYCEKRAEILESFLPTMENDNVSKSLPTSNEQGKKHLYIYATEKGRDCWENQARENLRREINMLQSGVIPGEKNN